MTKSSAATIASCETVMPWVVNASAAPVVLPREAKVLLSSQPLRQDQGRLLIPPTTATWLEATTVA